MDGWRLAAEQELFLRGSRTTDPGVIDVTTSFDGHFAGGDGDAMMAAVRDVVRRHEALRLRIDRSDDAIVQTFAARSEVPVAMVTDAAGCEPPAVDVWRSGPIAAVVSPGGPGGHGTVRIALHHLAYDGWSLAAIKREIGALYGAFAAGVGTDPGAAAADPPASGYSAYLSRLASPVPWLPAAQSRFWAGLLRGARPWRLPATGRAVDHPLPIAPVTAPVNWESDTTFAAAARRLGEPVSVLLIGAALLTCMILSGDTEVTLSHIYGGRDSPDTASMIGPVGLRQLYLRQRIDAGRPVADLLGEVHATWLRGIMRSAPPYSAPRLFGELPCGHRFAYLGDPSSGAAGEVVVNLSTGTNLAVPVDGSVEWVGGGGALATHPAAPLLIDAVAARFEDSVRLYWRPDVLSSEYARRYADILAAVLCRLTRAAGDTPLSGLCDMAG